VKFCQFVAIVYPHMLTNLGRFSLIFNKTAQLINFVIKEIELLKFEGRY